MTTSKYGGEGVHEDAKGYLKVPYHNPGVGLPADLAVLVPDCGQGLYGQDEGRANGCNGHVAAEGFEAVEEGPYDKCDNRK